MYVRPRPRFRPRNAGSGNTPSLALEFNQLSALPSYVTFSRGTQAMQYGSDGTLQYAPNNLLTYSNQADNAAWTKSNSFVQTNLLTYSQDFANAAWLKTTSTVTADTVIAPDGTSTADTITATTVGANQGYVQQSFTAVASTVYAFSIFVKHGTESSIALQFGCTVTGVDSGCTATFNVSTGSASTTTNYGSITTSTASISAAANGFYRCILVATVPAGTITGGINRFFPYAGSDAANTYAYAWGAQLVQGSVPGNYQATTSAALPVLYADYNGALRARKLCEDAANSSHRANQTVTMPLGAETTSIYVKAGERTKFQIDCSDNLTGNAAYLYDLSAGTTSLVLATGSWTGISPTITPLSNGWYRCILTAVRGAGTGVVFNITLANAAGAGSYTGDGSSGIYIADAQLTPGYLPLDVTETTSAAVYGPRFDYDPVTKVARGLLIEEQRANLLTYSNDWTNVAWSKTNMTPTPASTTSPEGVVNAFKLEATTSAATSVITPTATVSATAATYSIFVKQGTGATTANTFGLRNFTTATTLILGTLNYSTGVWTYTTGSSGVTVTNVGNGWWRLQISASTGITSGDTVRAYVGWTGNAATAGDFLYAYGTQLEAGAFSTSYIPTVASTATRNADSASITTLTFWFNAAAGTVYSQIDTNASAAPKLFSRLGPTISGSIGPYATSTSVILDKNGTGSLITTAGTLVVSNTKTAWAYDGTNVAMSVNGGAVATAAGALGTPADALYIGRDSSAVTNLLNGHIQSLRYYPIRLPNASLQSITV